MNVVAKDNSFINNNAYSAHYPLPFASANGLEQQFFFIGRASIFFKTQIFFRSPASRRQEKKFLCNLQRTLPSARVQQYFLLLGMTDVHSSEIMSYNISRIKGKNIRPEMPAKNSKGV
jgi:hypothetical protein